MKRVFILAVLFMMNSHILAMADDAVLARIGDKKIVMSDFMRMITYFDINTQKILEQQPQSKAIILENIVQRMVISEKARDRGFDKRPDIKEQIELYSMNLLTAAYLKEEVIAKINIVEDDIKSYYKDHQEEFETPEMLRVRQILIRSPKNTDSAEDKNKKREKAVEILKRLKAGEDFAKLASEFSDDTESKGKGGDLGFITRGGMIDNLEEAAFSLNTGEVSSIIETPYGFHIIKLEEKRESFLEPYEKIKDKIKEKIYNDLKKTRVDEFVKKAMKEAGVELNIEHFYQKR